MSCINLVAFFKNFLFTNLFIYVNDGNYPYEINLKSRKGIGIIPHFGKITIFVL